MHNTAATLSPPLITSIASVGAARDAWLVDIWGVMHNGVKPFVPAVSACEKFRAAGGTVLLLSNAPRPASGVAAQLDRIGVARTAWDAIVSSGDAARAFVSAYAPGPVFHLGPERDLSIYDGLGVSRGPADAAKAIVCTGLFDDETETPGTYTALLKSCNARGLPMVCANPDLTVERGGRIIYCAGAVAGAYEALGGHVTYAGKPHLPVYDMAFAELALLRGHDVSREAVLAIGDGIRTDIAGAANANVQSVYIASGVHLGLGGVLDASELATLFPAGSPQPVAAMSGLAWL
jgi:HAD superfamily hydrolase (TIGR01459 family)